jgi:hypothetical protein
MIIKIHLSRASVAMSLCLYPSDSPCDMADSLALNIVFELPVSKHAASSLSKELKL